MRSALRDILAADKVHVLQLGVLEQFENHDHRAGARTRHGFHLHIKKLARLRQVADIPLDAQRVKVLTGACFQFSAYILDADRTVAYELHVGDATARDRVARRRGDARTGRGSAGLAPYRRQKQNAYQHATERRGQQRTQMVAGDVRHQVHTIPG